MDEAFVAPLTAAARAAPSAPGVYFFLGDDGELLYVGKAGDLRQRLGQHAMTKPTPEGYLSGRYQLVRRVRWQETRDEDAAATREADLIVCLRPRFNASTDGKWTYLVVTPGAGTLVFEAERHGIRAAQPRTTRVYGCFPHLGKGVGFRSTNACIDGYAALLRLLWAAWGKGDAMPGRIARGAPDRFETAVDASVRPPLHELLSGVSARVLRPLLAAAIERRDAYMHPALRRDAVAAKGFFTYGPRQLRELRMRHGEPAGPLARERIVELVASEVSDLLGRTPGA